MCAEDNENLMYEEDNENLMHEEDNEKTQCMKI